MVQLERHPPKHTIHRCGHNMRPLRFILREREREIMEIFPGSE